MLPTSQILLNSLRLESADSPIPNCLELQNLKEHDENFTTVAKSLFAESWSLLSVQIMEL